jgi:hypothetical protein
VKACFATNTMMHDKRQIRKEIKERRKEKGKGKGKGKEQLGDFQLEYVHAERPLFANSMRKVVSFFPLSSLMIA